MQGQEEGSDFPSQDIFNRILLVSHDPTALLPAICQFFVHFQPQNGFPSLRLPQRIRLFEMKAFEHCITLLQRFPDDTEICTWIWKILRDAVCVFDNENDAEFCTIDLALQYGIIPALMNELQRPIVRTPCLSHAFSTLTTICLVERHAERVTREGIAQACVNIFSKDLSEDFITSALGSLKNLAMCSACVPLLIDMGAAEAARRYTGAISSKVDSTLKLGLCACSLLIRLEGGDKWKIDLLYDNLFRLLRAVFMIGPRGTVIQSGWNPANIVLDMWLLSMCDANKQKLARAVHLIADGMRERGEKNLRLIKFSVATLFQLYLAYDTCAVIKLAFDRANLSIFCEMTRVMGWGELMDLETLQMAWVLKNEMQDHLLVGVLT